LDRSSKSKGFQKLGEAEELPFISFKEGRMF
jgi:hypothetical protein